MLLQFLDLLLQACQQCLEAALHHLVHVSPLPLLLASPGVVEEWQQRPKASVPCRIWRLDTSSDWWDLIVLERWGDQQWTQNFRMKKDTFLELCEWLAPALQRWDTRMRPANCLQKHVAIALWKLSMPDSCRSVGNQFGVGRSTIGAVLMEVVKVINQVLLHRVVHLTDPDMVIRGFGALGFSNCGGAIDGTHIPIRAMEHQVSQYINHKGYFSIFLQAVCDHWGINVGWSGKAHDSGVFWNSSVCQRLQAGTFFPDCATSGLGTWTCPSAWCGMRLTSYSSG
ncbi:uncharacterized protein LOC142826495 [Pelodiscus sinensis]|uniref:uncharacterized protein LOC142826495 n=1 Tax=Pelodiscus sinensis TaxID=13735 RepID=UPI003F6A927A